MCPALEGPLWPSAVLLWIVLSGEVASASAKRVCTTSRADLMLGCRWTLQSPGAMGAGLRSVGCGPHSPSLYVSPALPIIRVAFLGDPGPDAGRGSRLVDLLWSSAGPGFCPLCLLNLEFLQMPVGWTQPAPSCGGQGSLDSLNPHSCPGGREKGGVCAGTRAPAQALDARPPPSSARMLHGAWAAAWWVMGYAAGTVLPSGSWQRQAGRFLVKISHCISLIRRTRKRI